MIDRVLARPGWVLALAALLSLALGAAAAGVRFDNTPETWLPSTGSGLEEYERFRARFGEDSLIVAFSDDADLATPSWRRDFSELAADLRGLAGVSMVEAPARASDSAEPDGVFSSPLAPHLVSADGSHAALAINPSDGLAATERSRLVATIEGVLARFEERVGPLRLAGADVITHDLDEGSARSLGGFSPLVFALMCLVFQRATRSWLAVGAMLVAAIAAATWTVGLVGLAGRTLNLIVVVMPAILAVVTAAQATHLLSRFGSLDASDGDPAERAQRILWWRAAVAATWRPCLLSAVTTAAGFASLAASEIPPIRDLGCFTAVGVLFSFLLTFSLVPALLSLSASVRPRPPAQRRWTPARAAALSDFLGRRAAPIVVVATAVTLVCGIGLSRLALESHILRFFPPDHRVPRNYEAIEAHLLGLTPFELILEGDRERVLSSESLEALDRYLEWAIEAEPLLQQALSPLGLGNGSGPPTETRAAVLRATLPRDSEELPDDLRRFVWVSGDRLALRTTLAARTSSSNACDRLAERLRAAIDGSFPAGVEAGITGGATLLIRGQVLLLDTQVRSFLLAFAVVTGVIVAAFRSAPVAALSLVPNLMPLVLTLGLMGFVGIPLNTATVTVAGIALGLIVDDTIHLLHGYWLARRGGRTAREAVADTLFAVGRPVLVTSVAVALGFGAFAFSPFRPTLYFGLLIAWTSLAAVVCDLVVLPALLQLRSRSAT